MRNSSLVKWFCAEDVTGLKFAAEASDILTASEYGRGAFQQRRRETERTSGAVGSENAGMSSEKKGENPFRRKPKDS